MGHLSWLSPRVDRDEGPDHGRAQDAYPGVLGCLTGPHMHAAPVLTTELEGGDYSCLIGFFEGLNGWRYFNV